MIVGSVIACGTAAWEVSWRDKGDTSDKGTGTVT